MSASKPLLAVLGPTATGKSALAIAIARAVGGEIINCDSTAVYRGFDIGTDKVGRAEQGGIPHHLIDIVDPTAEYTAADYARDASRLVRQVHSRGRVPLLVGGTGFYFRALTRGLFPGPGKSDELRARLGRIGSRRGDAFLWRMVRRVDPPSAGRILPGDRKRLVRALEVYFQTGKPLTAHFADTVSPLGPDVAVTALALRLESSRLAERLARRVDAQFKAGLLDEVQGLLARGVPPAARPFGGLVYRQVVEFLRGVRTLDATRDLIVQENRRYARRQLIWFRKEPNLIWFDGPGEVPEVQASVLGWLANRGLLIDGGPAAHG
ncbi:MAG TPA: tRNA (adenosine(37)-N6)-dimethylallyltransferase MiaA [Vicinamibacterales bacterium]|nr:tRNA (adenosine(37)-N6)-dimethylallyltransferase MiaA [Vicinamibacterales bacterium]